MLKLLLTSRNQATACTLRTKQTERTNKLLWPALWRCKNRLLHMTTCSSTPGHYFTQNVIDVK